MPAPLTGIAPAAAVPEVPSTRFTLKAKSVATPHVPARSQVARAAPTQTEVKVGQVVDRVRAAQTKLDRILSLAQSGKTFTPAELLALQGQVYRSSQEIELGTRVVEKGTGGVKQVLQTQA